MGTWIRIRRPPVGLSCSAILPRSSITCFHGEVDESQIQPMPAMGGEAMPKPDLAAAAKKLGVTERALMEALGKSMPPDTAAAARKLGVTEAALLDALGIKGKP